MYRAATFASKREAKDWAMAVESQLGHVAASGFAPVPKAATLGDLIDKYRETQAREPGRTKAMTLEMLKRDLGSVKLASLNSIVMPSFSRELRKWTERSWRCRTAPPRSATDGYWTTSTQRTTPLRA